MPLGRQLLMFAAACSAASSIAAQAESPCVAVKFDEGGTLPIAKSAILRYQALLEWPGPERIFAVDIVKPQSTELPAHCAIDALRLAPLGQGPMPDCTVLSGGKRACTYRIASSDFGANVVMQATCDAETVRQVVLAHVERRALASCNQNRRSERSNNALLTDAYPSALRASFGAAKRER